MTTADPSHRLQQLERALAGSRDGHWERDLLSGGIWYSESFFELLGLKPDDLPNVRGAATARVHLDDRRRFREAYDDAIRTLGRFDYEVRYLHGDGSWRWIRGRGRVWPGPDGQARFITGTVSDVHAEKTALLALEQQRQQLEALVAERTAGLQAALALAEQRQREAEMANAAKSIFLAQMSHEIRTPLNGVLGLTELALRQAEAPSQRRYLETSQQSGQALLRVINDVLDFSRIEAGGVELQPRPFDMPQLLADALRGVMPLVTGRPLALLYDWRGAHERMVGDGRLVQQILNNLLGNAIKFTEQGHISVCGESRLAPDGRLQVSVRIEDTGPGIAPAQRERVFEAFVQGDERLSRAHGGTGLGLAIARRLARAMGGELALDPQYENGTAMLLTLTLRASLDPPAPAGLPGAGCHVWLVYPNALAAAWTEARFERLGGSAETVTTLAAAIEAAQALARGEPTPRRAPQLVLVAEQALGPESRLQPLHDALPQAALHLVIRPDWYQPAIEAESRLLGIGHELVPFTPATLRALVAGAGQPVHPQAPAPLLRRDADVLLVEDNPVNQLVGSEFLRALGLRVRIANEGTEALQACQAQPPDLVLMDLQMPGMDGLEATRRLRAMQQQALWPGAPIVALTAHAGDADRRACAAVGMDAVLTKPLTLDTLQRELARWLAA
ncbi:response regulator [Aquabacterium sp.]|uniref:PAS domain-containing hybrid sensor histidine kinase/response regulator n=1 Tax=Aquabacterium sp. TaxID=1872578 RepID=UPI003783E910